MAIRYSLQRDPLNASEAYHAHVIPAQTLTLPDLIQRMAQAGTTLSTPDLLAATELLMVTVTAALQEGCHVNLPLCRLRPAVRGTFSSPADAYQPDRHHVTVTAAAGTELKKALHRARVQRDQGERGTDRPTLLVYLDGTARSSSGALTPGGFGELHGRRLRFDPAGAGEGVFLHPLLPSGEPAALPAVAVTAVALRTDTRLLFQVPALPAGDYRCTVRRRFGRQGTLLREGALPKVLTVA